MGLYVNPGNQGFAAIRKGTYVDKSGLISLVNRTLGTAGKLTCISRPRRFGKSFAAQMLTAYYDRSCDSRSLFADLAIANAPDFETHRNRYDVLCVDMTGILADAPDKLQVVSFLKDTLVQELRRCWPDAEREETLTGTLYQTVRHTGVPFVCIIDEWDVLLREMDDVRVQEEYIELLRALFKNINLTNQVFAGVYMTGILPIRKYRHQSAVSDFQEYTMVDPSIYAEYVGFTEADVRSLCGQYGADFEELKKWYDGYVFPQAGSIYNPSSVMKALERRSLQSYWVATTAYDSLRVYIDMDFEGVQEAIISMLGGSPCKVDTYLFENDLQHIDSRDAMLTLLIHLGYLSYDLEKSEASIPNEEIRREFIRSIRHGKREELAALVRNSDSLLRAVLEGDEARVAEAVAGVHETGVAPLYYNDEQSLRYVIRFAFLSAVDEYVRIEELPSGRGYADVVYLPKKQSALPALVVELKWDKPVEAAIDQIRDRRYPSVLEQYGGEVVLVGITYNAATKEHVCRLERV